MLYPVLNDLHDLDDLQMLQMRKSKDAADITNVFKTKTGELPANGLEAQRFTINRATNANVETLETRTDYIRKASGGGRTIAIRTDETLEQNRSDTPSIADQAHWDYVLSKICAGVGISKLLVMPFSLQGTVTRADLDTAAVFFRSRSAVLASAFESIYRWCMEWAVYSNANNLGDPPADFLRVTVRPPRSVNVDVGRNSAALINEYRAGWLTLEGICGALGEDWREILRQRAKERKVAGEIEAEFEIPNGSLIEAALEAIQQEAATNPPQPAAVPA
jgi:capsid protein